METGEVCGICQGLEVEVFWHHSARTALLSNLTQAGGGNTGMFFLLCVGGGERTRRAIDLCNRFKDSERAYKIARLQRLPAEYDFDYQIYSMAKTLGVSEQQIKDEYSLDEIIERNLFEVYQDYIDRELMKAK